MEKYLIYIDCSNFILYLNLITLLSFSPSWIARASCIPPVFAHHLLLTFWPLLPLLFSLQVMTARQLSVGYIEINLFSSCTYMWRIQWVESNMDCFIWHLEGEKIPLHTFFQDIALVAFLLSWKPFWKWRNCF